MSEQKPGIIFDASNSWNGYNHQGKVALWVAIKYIIDLWDVAKSEEQNLETLINYFLEIEYLEDFSIGIKEEKDIKYISVHQVKNKNEKILNSYESALLGLAQHFCGMPTIEEAFLHVTTDLGKNEDEVFNYVKLITATPECIQKDINEINNKRTDNIFRNELLKIMRGRPTAFKQNLINALRERFNTNVQLNEGNLDEAFNLLLKKLNDKKTELKELNDDTLKKIKIFSYPIINTTQNYCGVDQISGLLKEYLKKYFTMKFGERNYKSTAFEFIDKCYLYILGKLDQHIIDRDLNYVDYKNDKKDRKIFFNKIIEWLDSDDIDSLGNDFYLFKVKESIFEHLNNYCKSCEFKDNCKADCKVVAFREMLGRMKFNDLERFLHDTNPQISIPLTIDSLSRFAAPDGIKNPIAKGLRDIGVDFLPDKYSVIYENKYKQQCELTTIRNEGEDRAEESICSEIIRNRNAYRIMMDCDYLISRDINVDSIQDSIISPKSGAPVEKEHIMRCKNVKIIDLEKFRTEVNKEPE